MFNDDDVTDDDDYFDADGSHSCSTADSVEARIDVWQCMKLLSEADYTFLHSGLSAEEDCGNNGNACGNGEILYQSWQGKTCSSDEKIIL